jgi:hypothetical protein
MFLAVIALKRERRRLFPFQVCQCRILLLSGPVG